jgi:lysozyme
MNFFDLMTQIKRHEGFSEIIYMDSEGFLTIGWGHALLPGSKMAKEVCERLLVDDINQATMDFNNLNLGIDENDTVRKYALINMIFNLGILKFIGFKKTIEAIRAKNWKEAAYQMLDSKWADQVGHRAIELAEMVETGKYKGD